MIRVFFGLLFHFIEVVMYIIIEPCMCLSRMLFEGEGDRHDLKQSLLVVYHLAMGDRADT